MHFQLQNLTRDTFPLLPDSCIHCGWWQGHNRGWSTEAAEEWSRAAEAQFGRWGKLATVDGKLLGMIQFAPAPLYSRSLPCGPPDRKSVLLGCGLNGGGGPDSVGKSLVLAALAEIKDDNVDLVEAFCRPSGPASDCRFLSQDFLRDCGFSPLRSLDGFQLMRLELGGLTRVSKLARHPHRGILRRIRHPSPAPVVFFGANRDLPLLRGAGSI